MEISYFTAILRILITFVLSFIFGLERQKEHKPVGFGTYIFVSIGACSIAILAKDLVPSNPLPLISAVISGIGFLGAGALIKTSDKIFGFTSAATIWLFAILGIVIGTGEYFLGSLIFLMIGTVIFFDRYLEKNSIGSYQRKIIIVTNKIINEKDIVKILLINLKSFKMNHVEIDKTNNKMTLLYLVEGNKEQINRVPKKLYENEWFESCKIE